MSSRNMCLLPRATLHSDSEQLAPDVLTMAYPTIPLLANSKLETQSLHTTFWRLCTYCYLALLSLIFFLKVEQLLKVKPTS